MWTSGGIEITVPPYHIKRGVEVRGVGEWAEAVFASPCASYALNSCYAQTINIKDEAYAVCLLCLARPESFQKHKSTTPSFKPTNEELNRWDGEFEWRFAEPKDVTIVSILLRRVGALKDIDAERYERKMMTDFD